MKSNVIPSIGAILITLIFCTLTYAQETGSLVDERDGTEYKTIKIGEQWWMSENLAFKTNSGCTTYTGIEDYVKTHGYLYNWKMALEVCPAGWHLPSYSEWTKLSNQLGGNTVAGGKMKEIGTTHWKSPNTGATNSSGFSALSSGRSDDNEHMGYIGYITFFWTSEDEGEEDGICMALYSAKAEITLYMVKKNEGFSVRCLKD